MSQVTTNAKIHPAKAFSALPSLPATFASSQGEDRWLCTLLLQRGWRVEYSAASDAFTACPEGFGEFFNQRRRWMPSTIANIFDVLSDYKHVTKVNEDISLLYVAYQVRYTQALPACLNCCIIKLICLGNENVFHAIYVKLPSHREHRGLGV
jgi:cellulose synthase/poly-beta-1,6-N-acetylglucosamine synthase-like glycosyltransferase